MERRKLGMALVLVLTGVAAGSLILTPMVNASGRPSSPQDVSPYTQVLLKTGFCQGQLCTDQLSPCGEIGGIVVDGPGTVLIVGSDGGQLWRLVSSGRSTHVSDTFDPGVYFNDTLSIQIGGASGLRYFIYGNPLTC